MKLAQDWPRDIEAEETLLGAVLVHPRVWGDVAFLDAREFFTPSHRVIFEAIAKLAERNAPIDPVAVRGQLEEAGELAKLNAQGGAAYLIELTTKVVTVENVGYYAQRVRGKAEVRRALALGAEIQRLALSGSPDEEILGTVQSRILAFALPSSGGAKAIRDAVASTVTTITGRIQRFTEGRPLLLVPTGFTAVDRLVIGFASGDMVVIAARPSMGKTALAMCIGINAARRGHPVFVVSAEMNTESLIERLIASEARVDSSLLRSGGIAPFDWQRAYRAASRLSDLPITLDDTGAPTVGRLRTQLRTWKLRHCTDPDRPGVVLIDYLQLVSSGAHDENRQQEVAAISRALKALAKELGVVLVVLSQLNRGVEARTDKRPTMADLRDSGAIEQDADVVAFIYREEYYARDECAPEDKGIAEIIVGKHRKGATGVARLAFIAEHTLFADLEEHREAPAPTPIRSWSGGRRHFTDDDES